MRPIIQIKDLTVKQNKKIILDDINLNIYPGDYIAIIGPNGGGKTTLIKSILGLISPTEGKIEIEDSSKIGYLPQYSHIDRHFPISVKEVIVSGIKRKNRKSISEKENNKVNQIIEKVGLRDFSSKNIEKLSGGELQRMLLGRALISDPDILILDEPNTYIDKFFEKELYAILKEINKNCTIILVSHDLNSVLKETKSMAYINQTLNYCPNTQIGINWLNKNYGLNLTNIESKRNCCF